MKRLIEDAISNGYNFIFEGTMGKSAGIIDQLVNSTIKYNVIARLMAVSREESLLSIFERFLEMKKSMGIGRLTSIKAHDVRYEGFQSIANTLEGKGIEVEVYERGVTAFEPRMIYKTSLSNNKYNSVNDAILYGREKSRKICMRNAQERLETINKEIYSFYGENAEILAQLDCLNAIINTELK